MRLPLPATCPDCGADMLVELAERDGIVVGLDQVPRWRGGTGMTTTEAQAQTIDGRARTVRELLDKAKYAIDFYQRE